MAPHQFHKLRLLGAILPLVLIAGCATPLSPEADRILDARSQDVKNCEEAGDVQGSASGFSLSPAGAMTRARNEALEKAAEKRATHVVWHDVEEGMTPWVRGTAYRCR